MHGIGAHFAHITRVCRFTQRTIKCIDVASFRLPPLPPCTQTRRLLHELRGVLVSSTHIAKAQDEHREYILYVVAAGNVGRTENQA